MFRKWFVYLKSHCNACFIVIFFLFPQSFNQYTFLQKATGYRWWAQWHPIRFSPPGGPGLVGFHLYTENGDDEEEIWGKAKISEHCACCSSWNFCGKVSEISGISRQNLKDGRYTYSIKVMELITTIINIHRMSRSRTLWWTSLNKSSLS